MNGFIRYAILAALMLVTLTGCETIKGFFPDKQQDYRYSTEIPPLELPPDLKSDNIKLDDDMHPLAASTSTPAVTGTADNRPAATAATETPQPQPAVSQHVVSWSEDNSRLRVAEPYEKAWLIVAKALTHKSVEITDRDRTQGVFFVQYDPQSYEVKDGSLWDEVAFFFGARDSHEQEYRVRVVDHETFAEVSITDNNDAPITQGPGLNLLKLLYETIKTDAEAKQQKQTKEPTNSGEEQNSNAEGSEKPKTEGEEKPKGGDAGGQSETKEQDTVPAGDDAKQK